jgi:hypothetical protein
MDWKNPADRKAYFRQRYLRDRERRARERRALPTRKRTIKRLKQQRHVSPPSRFERLRIELKYHRQVWRKNASIAAAERNAAAEMVESLLAADQFDSTVIKVLADRKNYSDAATALLKNCRTHKTQALGAVIPALLETTLSTVTLYRLAVAFAVPGLFDKDHKLAVTTDIHFLRAHKSLAARLVLAVIGEPQASFNELTKSQRAALVLGHLVRERLA